MKLKRGDVVPQPTLDGEWEIYFATTEAARGWTELVNAARTNTRQAWEIMGVQPGPGPGKPTARHHPLRYDLSTNEFKGQRLQQWQIEVTGGGRIWYLCDAERQTVWVKYAGVGHPKSTE